MTERYRRYNRAQFKAKKARIARHLPALAITLYSAKVSGAPVPAEMERTLGRVISAVNNPYYGVTDEAGRPLPYESQLADEVILEYMTGKLFIFVKSLSIKLGTDG